MFDPEKLKEEPKKSEGVVPPEAVPGIKREKERESTGEVRETPEIEIEIEKLRRGIDRAIGEEQSSEAPKKDPKSREEKIKEYQERYIPDYLRGKKGFVARAVTGLWTGMVTRINGKCEREGTENIPEKGPFIVIANHFGAGDTEAILGSFKNTDVHFGVAKEIWWHNPAKWLLKKLGTIPIKESLSNLSEQEKEEALQRQGGHGKKVFREIIDREKNGGVAMNAEFFHQAVALLLRGDAMGIYPEGLWLRPEGNREPKEMKQGYHGLELLASQYKKLTGEELPIVPTAYIEDAKTKTRRLIVGEPLKLSENKTGLNGTDWCMAHVAEMLPEEQRGYYKELARKYENI